MDAAGNVFIADTLNHRVRVVLAKAPRFDELAPAQRQIELSARSRGVPAAERLSISTSVDGLPLLASVSGVSFRAAVAEGADWLTVSPDSGSTPRQVRVSADPRSLAPVTTRAVSSSPCHTLSQRSVLSQCDSLSGPRWRPD